jgi:hypothetical protein
MCSTEHMSFRNPSHVTLHIRCALPVEVMLGAVRWRISIDTTARQSNNAEIIAVSSDGKRGRFVDGRATVTERELRCGISIPLGTVRYRLALALAAAGKAELEFGSDAEF